MEDTIEKLKQFSTMKALMAIHNKENPYRKRNVIVEWRNGDHGLLHMHADENSPFPRLSEIKCLTFIVDGKEYEFVACESEL